MKTSNLKKMTRVVNRHKEDFDIYIGRGTVWGNKYRIGEHGTRKQVMDKYDTWLARQIKKGKITKQDFETLYGKRLGCSCKPKACHGDIVVKYMYIVLNKYKLSDNKD